MTMRMQKILDPLYAPLRAGPKRDWDWTIRYHEIGKVYFRLNPCTTPTGRNRKQKYRGKKTKINVVKSKCILKALSAAANDN